MYENLILQGDSNRKNLDPCMILVLTEMSPPKNKKDLQFLLEKLSYHSKYLPKTGEVCDPYKIVDISICRMDM